MKKAVSFLVALTILIITLVAAPASASAGVWAQWIFDPAHMAQQTFTAIHGLPGTAAGVVGWTDGPDGQWYGLDGSTNHIVCYSGTPDGLALPAGSITLEAWVRIDSTADYQGIVGFVQDNGSYERGWWLGTYSGRFTFAVSSAGRNYLTWLNADSVYQIGQWYHVVAVYDGSVMQIYVDGKLAGASTNQTGDIIYPEKGSLAIGAYLDDNEQMNLKGALREVRIYSQALTASEIAASKPGRIESSMAGSNIFAELDDLLKVTSLGINNQEKAIAFDHIYSSHGKDADFVHQFLAYCAGDLNKYYWLGIYLYDQYYTNIGDYDLALATLNLGLKLSQGSAEVRFYFAIGQLYWYWDKKELGRPYFEKAFALAEKYPGNIPAQSPEQRIAIDAYYGLD